MESLTVGDSYLYDRVTVSRRRYVDPRCRHSRLSFTVPAKEGLALVENVENAGSVNLASDAPCKKQNCIRVRRENIELGKQVAAMHVQSLCGT